MLHKSKLLKIGITLIFSLPTIAIAQTPISGFFPAKNDLTFALGYSYKSYDKFYRGSKLSDSNPADLGEISASIIGIYGEYGITDWLSATATLPHITVKSEDGVLDPIFQKDEISGIQNLTLYLKAKGFEKNFDNSSKFSLGAAIGGTLPVGGYDGEGILAIGNNATAIDGVALVQYISKFKVFAELQGGYSYRENSDYPVPDAMIYSAKIGYFNNWFYVDAKLGVQNSTSGLDIGTPEFGAAGGPRALPQTEVDYTNLSFSLYIPVYKKSIGISTGYHTNIEGRNYGDESSFNIGLVCKSN